MDDKNQNGQYQPVTIQPSLPPQHTDEELVPEFKVPVITAEKLLSENARSKSTKRALWIAAIVIIVMLFLLGLTIVQVANDAKHIAAHPRASKSTAQNPFNGSSVNSQVQYCSDPVHAATEC